MFLMDGSRASHHHGFVGVHRGHLRMCRILKPSYSFQTIGNSYSLRANLLPLEAMLWGEKEMDGLIISILGGYGFRKRQFSSPHVSKRWFSVVMILLDLFSDEQGEKELGASRNNNPGGTVSSTVVANFSHFILAEADPVRIPASHPLSASQILKSIYLVLRCILKIQLTGQKAGQQKNRF